ncbi:MAG: hypothetical protein VB858_13970, partial [Planctomycetaceae bacterium]
MGSWTAYPLISSGPIPESGPAPRERNQTLVHRFRRMFLPAVLLTGLFPGPVLSQAPAPEQARPPAGPDAPVPSTAAASDQKSLARLGEKSVATAIRLSDAQQTAVAAILKARETALSTASEATRAKIEADAEAKLQALLSDDQQRLYTALFSGSRLKFNFRLQKWPEVLDWFADEAGLSLVMDEPPPGTFNYSDTKEYTTTEAINLLNGWLLIKGYTLVRRERLLMCVSLKAGLPEGAIPRISLDELATRGRFEFVSVLFPLDGRESDAVVSEVAPLLGTYGKAQPLPSTGQILIYGTAGTLQEVTRIARLVPVAETKTPKKPVPPPKPVLAVYPIEHANPGQAGEVLKQIVEGTVLVDETAKQISINAIPAEQDKAKIVITQLESNQGPDRQSELQLYALRNSRSGESLTTLQLIIPDAQ